MYFVLNVPAFRQPFSLKISSEPRKARQKLHFYITCTTYINSCTSNKWLLKAVSFPHFFNRTLNIIILINILEKAQIFIGSKHQVFTPGLESTSTDKPVSLFIKTYCQTQQNTWSCTNELFCIFKLCSPTETGPVWNKVN